MTGISGFPVWTAAAAIAWAAAVGSAQAVTPYDGPWQVTITTVRGACSSGVGFGLQIRDGVVHGYSSDFYVGGRVSRSGTVHVSVSSGQQRASGGGRLRGYSGYGDWRGVGTQGFCSGYWSASRG